MDEHPASGTRMATGVVALSSALWTGVLLLTWVPVAASAEPDRSFRPMGVAPFLLITLVLGTLPGLVIGPVQLLWRPRMYGLISLVVSGLPYVAFQFTCWLLLDLRGISWAD